MARPKRNRAREDEIRTRIQTNQLVKRLSDDALGKITLEDGRRRSIEILLRKSLPDLATVTLAGDGQNPLKLVIEWAQKPAS
jgi:hypothetical protein